MPAKGKARIIALGSYLPERAMTNQDFEKLFDTSDEWIVSRTGIQERRIARDDEFPSDMGTMAAKKALATAKIDPSEIDLIIVATMTPDYISPSTAAIVQANLKAVNAAAFDVQAACTGFLYGLSLAKAYVETGAYRNILLIASEKMSYLMDYTDRTTSVLFGDGACAAIISSEGEGLVIDTICLGADGSLSNLLMVPAGGSRQPATSETIAKRSHFLQMEGKEVFKHAVRRMTAASKECLEKAGLKSDQISWIVPHQANLRIMDAIAKNFDVSSAKVYRTVHKYGNTSASSVAIALDELVAEQPVPAGNHLLLVAFGAGFTWGACILTKRG